MCIRDRLPGLLAVGAGSSGRGPRSAAHERWYSEPRGARVRAAAATAVSPAPSAAALARAAALLQGRLGCLAGRRRYGAVAVLHAGTGLRAGDRTGHQPGSY